MNNDVLKAKQQEAMDQYKRNLEAEPDVKKWIDQKKKIRLFAIIFLLAYYVVEFLAYDSVKAEINMTRLVIKALVAVCWMAFFMLPTAPWKVSCMFYVSAAWNFWNLCKMYINQKDFSLYFQNGSFLAIFFVMSVAIPFLLLALACWLTIPMKNRELADRAQDINQEFVESVKQISK